ncbi:MAG: phage head completion protein [Sandaracinobacteroides sp.]
MAEFSGRLSQRVRFEGRDEQRSAAGELSSAWVFRFERWAMVEPVARAERTALSADTRHSARRWRVTLRDGVRPTLDMRMRWLDETMVPTGIEVDPAEPGRIVVWAQDTNS